MNVGDYIADGRCTCCGQALNSYWTPARMVDAMVAWVAEHGTVPNSNDWVHGTPDHPPHSLVTKMFGRWNNLVRAAGLTPYKPGQRPWLKHEIAAAMLDWLLKYGEWPTSTQWSKRAAPGEPPRPHFHTVVTHFGSWAAAKRFAGWTGDPGRVLSPRRGFCVGCGVPYEERTIGCLSCDGRVSQRNKRERARKAEATATPLRESAVASDNRKVATT